MENWVSHSCSATFTEISHMEKLFIFAILILSMAQQQVHAAPPPPPEELQKTLSSFFGLLKADKVDEAYVVVLANARINKGKDDDVVKGLKKQTREAIATYGPILGFELIDQKRVGTTLLQLTCLSWSDHFPLRWRFTYYRPGDKWRLLDIFVDDKVGELFDRRPATHAPASDKGD